MNDGIFNDIKLAQSGDRKKAEKIVEENAGLIWSVVRRFLGRGVDADDLYQLGCMGLLKAIDGFDEFPDICPVRIRSITESSGRAQNCYMPTVKLLCLW